MKFLIYIFSLIVLLTSCLEWKNKNYFATIQVLNQDVKIMIDSARVIDTVKANQLFKERKEILNQYKLNASKDTLSIQTAQHLENIKYSVRCLKLFYKNKQTIADLNIKQNELLQIKKLIQNGHGDRSSYDEILTEEIQNIAHLRSNFNRLMEWYLEGIRNFEESEQYLNELIKP